MLLGRSVTRSLGHLTVPEKVASEDVGFCRAGREARLQSDGPESRRQLPRQCLRCPASHTSPTVYAERSVICKGFSPGVVCDGSRKEGLHTPGGLAVLIAASSCPHGRTWLGVPVQSKMFHGFDLAPPLPSPPPWCRCPLRVFLNPLKPPGTGPSAGSPPLLIENTVRDPHAVQPNLPLEWLWACLTEFGPVQRHWGGRGTAVVNTTMGALLGSLPTDAH